MMPVGVSERRSARPRIRIACLGYHDICDDPAYSGFQRRGARAYRMTAREFVQQLDAIGRLAYAPSLITDIDWSRPGRHLLLTFDDGGRSALEAGAELCRRGWRGHFFITTARLGQRTFLDAAGVRELHRCGHVIGSHSHTHPDIIRELPFTTMLQEWLVSRDILSQLLGADVGAASVPGGDISAGVLRSGACAGYRFLFTSEPRLTPQYTRNCWILGRAVLKQGISPRHVAQLADFDGWARAGWKRMLKNSARRSFPALYRRYRRVVTAE